MSFGFFAEGPSSRFLKERSLSKRYLTFFVLSNDSTRSRQFKIPLKKFKLLKGLSICLVLVISFVVFDYVRLRGNISEVHNLRKENTAQRIELQSFSSKMRAMESQLSKLRLFDKKLRIIANIEKPRGVAAREQLMGVGGGSPSSAKDYLLTPGSKVDELVRQMRSDISHLETIANSQESSFSELQGYLMRKSSYLAATPSIWPVRGWVTSTFGQRISPFTGLPHKHKGMDIANRSGTAVVAPADGVVVKARREGNLGNTLVIKHGYGVSTIYGHLAKFSVRVGHKVKRGQKIATMGNTGRSTGPHLHYAVRVNGVMINPTKYILN